MAPKLGQPALGVPGQKDGRPTLQSDRGDETQAVFHYQWAAGVVCLVGALSRLNSYTAIWCEHHDDLLAELENGAFHAIQVKTVATQGATWKCSDGPFASSIAKFCDLESKYAGKIERFIFFSNAKPYIPSPTVTSAPKLSSSPMRLRHACREVTTELEIEAPYKKAFDDLATKTERPAAIVFRVLQKLEFMTGPPLEGFREHLAPLISKIPGCRQFTIERIDQIRDELLQKVGKAHSLDVALLEFYASILQEDGRPQSAAAAKSIRKEEFDSIIRNRGSQEFRYADLGGTLQLGKASGQRETLRLKMEAGLVSPYFESVWLQAMSAERKLLALALEDPEAAMRVAKQLESVMLVECQNAEAGAALETDVRRRGHLIYQQILKRTEELSRDDKETVEHERPETLRGVAGLLSGSCKFAWGIPITKTGGKNGP